MQIIRYIHKYFVDRIRENIFRRNIFQINTVNSDDSTELDTNPELEIDYIVAPPRMALYLEYSTRIYSVYLKYIAPEDIFPYSIDEVFMAF